MNDPPRAEDALSLPPAGWYPDPEAPEEGHRYWDGERWTDQRRALASHHVAIPLDPPRRLRTPAIVAIAGLVIVGMLELFNLVADARYIALVQDALDGRQLSPSEVEDAEDLVDGASGGLVGGYLLIGPIAFLPWFFRAYRNLARFGIPDLRYAPGWAIGSWFIPIFNLFRPKQIANDIDRGSGPGAIVNDGTWHQRAVARLLHWWWGIYIFDGVLGAIAGMVIAGASEDSSLTQTEALEQERAGYVLDVLASIAGIAAIVLAILVIRRITRMQEAVIEDIRSRPSDSLAATVGDSTEKG